MTRARGNRPGRAFGAIISAAVALVALVPAGVPAASGASTGTTVTPMTTCAPDWTRVGTSLICELKVVASTTTPIDLPDGVTFDAIVVGGGGGGGGGGGWYMTGPRRDTFTAGGGGGGGEVIACTGLSLPDPVSVTVGSGGAAGANRRYNTVGDTGGTGGSSSIGTCTATGGIGGYGGWGKTYADWTATLNMGTYGKGGTSGTGKVGMTANPYNPPGASTGAYGVWAGGGGGSTSAATSGRGGQGTIPRNGLFATNSVVYGTGGGGASYSNSLSMANLAATGADFSRVASPSPANTGGGGGGGLGAGAQSTVFVDNASSAGASGVVVLRYSLTVTIKANDASSTYGGPISPVGYTVSGLGAGDWIRPGLACNAYNVSTVITAPYRPGSYTTKCTGSTTTGLGVPVSYTTGTYTLSKAPLTITARNHTAAYGTAVTLSGTAPTTDWSVTSGALVYSDAIASVTLTASGTPAGTDSTANAGNYTVSPSAAVGSGLAVVGASLSDLYAITYVDGALHKTKVPLTVTAHPLQLREGDPDPTTYGYDVTGWVLGETEGTPPAGWTAPTCTSPYDSGTTTVGDSPLTITCASGAATNYEFTYVSAHLFVTPQSIVVTPHDVYTTYDGTAATVPAYDISDYPDEYVFDDAAIECGIFDSPGSTTDLAGTVLKPGTYSTVCTGPSSAASDGDTLEVIYEVGTYIVNKAKLSVDILDQAKEYGETDVDTTATAYEVVGLVGGDSLEVALSFEDGDLAGSDVGVYDITGTPAFAPEGGGSPGVSVARIVDDYYDVTIADGVLTVTPAVLVVTPRSLAPIFGENVTDYPYDIPGTWKNGEGLGNLPKDWTAPVCTSIYQTTLPIGTTVDITCDDGSARNYVFEYGTAALTVSDPEVVITNTSERTYTTATGSMTVSLSATVDRFVPGCEIIWTLDPSEGTNSPYSVFLDDETPSLDVVLPQGAYVVTVSVAGNCTEKQAIDNPAVIVVSPEDVGYGATGGGWYRAKPGGDRINFGFVVHVKTMGKDRRTGEEVRTYWGESTWMVKYKWRLKARISKTVTQYADGSLSGVQPYTSFTCPAVWSNPVPVDPRCGAFTGEAALERFVLDGDPDDDGDLDHPDGDDGHWETVGVFGYRTRVYDGATNQKCSRKSCQTINCSDFYGLDLWALPGGPAVPTEVPTGSPVNISYGQIRVGKR